MSFANRLVLLAVGVAVLTAGILILGAGRFLRQELEQVFITELELESRLIAAAIADRAADFDAFADAYGERIGRRVSVIDGDGFVLGDSDFDGGVLAALDNHRTRPEVVTVLDEGRTGVHRRVSASTNRDELKVAVPGGPGVVRISATVDQIDAVVGGAARITVVAGIVAVLLGSVLAIVAARAVARPVRDLAGAVDAMAQNESREFPQTQVPEIRDLVEAFRDMHANLEGRLAQLRREREETSTLIESMVEGVVAASPRGKVFLCNGAMRAFLRLPPDQPLPELTDLFYQPDARRIVDDVLDGKPVLGREVEFDGRIVMMTARPLPNGGAVLGLLDISDVRRAQLVRRDFVANVSHELKTPLTSIIGYAETLLDDEVNRETQINFLRVILSNGRRMQSLVDDLLDLARVESGAWQPNPELIDVLEVTREAWSSVADRRPGREIAFGQPPDVRMVADRDAVLQILTNLIDNAYRHTTDGGSIAVSAEITEREVLIVVRDTGSGIPPEHLPRVFERFYRVDPGRSRKEGGTGLGLAIVKHLCEVQGAHVEIESTPGEGTTVRLRFPVVQLRFPASTEPSAERTTDAPVPAPPPRSS